MGAKPSPFGMDVSLLRTCAESLSRMGSVRLRGPHAHLASGLGAGGLLAAAGRLAGAYAWNISHHSFLMHPPPAFHYLPLIA